MSKSERKSQLPAEPTHGYEFFGPPGAFLISVFLPIICYTFAFVCNDISGCPASILLTPSKFSLAQLKRETGWPGVGGLFSAEATAWTLGYYLLSLTLYAFLPADEPMGTELRSGGKLKYRFNAFSSATVILGGLAASTVLYGADNAIWTYIWEHYVEILTANLIVSFVIATFVYINSFGVKSGNAELRELAAGGHSGNMIYDWFIGRELNPRIDLPIFGNVDLKIWCEMRPGLLGWIVLDYAFMAHQYATYGLVSDSMILICAFQTLYVIDALYMEPAILTTMDITTDGFGFMLSFGDLVWVPFIYSLQAHYLAVYPVHLGVSGIAGILAVQGLGYYLFRAANNEKNRFRTNPDDPKVAHLKYITTKSGSKLLVSGWWGTARHINYLGDWIMAWSYCLPTGLAGYVIKRNVLTGDADVVQNEAKGWGMAVTYFYIVYFGVLLVHRELRDEEKCERKYGADWEEYKKRVKYRIIPYIY